MRRLGLSLSLLLVVVAAGSVPARAAGPCDPSFCESHVATVEMTDGVTLDASLYLPVEPLPLASGLPLIVRQHGGGSNKDSEYDLTYGIKYVETGKFALLTYSHRGHGSSGGLFDFFGHRTTLDFSAMLNWVECCSGYGALIDTANVGASGYSQGGGESLLPAARDDRVKAVGVGNTFDDLNHALNPNDCFKFSFATGIFALAYKASASRTHDDLAIRWGAQLYTDTEDLALPGFGSTTDDLRSRSPLTFVEGGDPFYARGLLDVPVFWTNAWEDQLFPADHPEKILEPLRAAGTPVHYWFASGGHAASGDDPADLAGKEKAMLEWFDEFLRGADHGFKPTDADPRPLVDYGERVAPGKPGAWIHATAETWPVVDPNRTFFPTAEGGLADSPTTGDVAVLVNDAASANLANDSLSHELLRQTGGRAYPPFDDVLLAVPEDADPLHARTFTSQELAADLHVVGSPKVHALIETSASRVVQLDAKVWDVSSAGAQLVWRGCVSRPVPAETIGFDLWPNAHRFLAGHRIALTLSVVDFPTFKPDTEPHVIRIGSGTTLELPEL